MVDRETDGHFIASIPDLGDLAAYGENEKDAVAHVAELAAGHVRAIVESGQPAPRARNSAELPSAIRSKEVGRSLIPVQVGRAAAKPGMSSKVPLIACPPLRPGPARMADASGNHGSIDNASTAQLSPAHKPGLFLCLANAAP
jgi:predicted RNase H-like HicB family nuclease